MPKMKSHRLILALSFASLLALSVARAGDDKAGGKSGEKSCDKMECCSRKDKDGRSSCATEGKSCCCDTGDKAKSEKHEEKK